MTNITTEIANALWKKIKELPDPDIDAIELSQIMELLSRAQIKSTEENDTAILYWKIVEYAKNKELDA